MPQILVTCRSKKKNQYNIEFDFHVRVRDLIEEFAQLMNLERENIYLIFLSKRMDPERTFQDYGIKKGDNIDLRFC